MASYLQKLRRQSKQFIDKKTQDTPPTSEPPKIEEATAGSSEPVKSPPVPAVTEPSDEPGAEPVLDEEDEKFLERLAAIAAEPEGTPPPLPNRMEVVDDKGQKKVGRDAQEALMDGADKVALPTSPPDVTESKDGGLGRKKSVMSYFSIPKFSKGKDTEKSKEKISKELKKKEISDKDRNQFADDLKSAAETAKNEQLDETAKENKELTDILDQLNLSAVNNRVFSFTKESEEMMNAFTQVLKDLVNGVPTAYNDLEKLFTDYDNQLKKMYGNLPPFMQNLIKSLPAKLTATLGPEVLAATAEKPGFDAKAAGAAAGASKRSKIPSIPSLKSLVTAQGAVATALRSIVNFLKFRFPALATGTNLIMSLAVFVLLFVFWYCHKRGRETRLEKERLGAEGEASGQGSSAASITEDTDSIFGDKPKKVSDSADKTTEKENNEVPSPPLILSDHKEAEEASTSMELPSVSHLPDPKSDKAPA